MNPANGFPSPRGFGGLTTLMAPLLILLLLLSSGWTVSGSSVSKAQVEHHHNHNHVGCDAIHRVLNETAVDSAGHHVIGDNDEGFLVDHDQWHNHKDRKYSLCGWMGTA